MFGVFLLGTQQGNAVSKAKYLDLIEMAVSAYSQEHMESYLKNVQTNGLAEHGFPRLTANLGVLLATGLRNSPHDKALFRTMMNECCQQIPIAKAKNGKQVGNDFSVKEIILCLYEIERAKLFPKEVTDGWRAELSKIVPKDTYSCIPAPTDPISNNWAIFSGASEQLRCHAGLGGIPAFVERQFAGQLRFFDANGMYKDPNQPMVYDGVTRLQFMVALRYGYDGPSRAFLEKQLLLSAEPTLLMQSVTGEIPFGGRSNQFLHNETFWCALCEWYAGWFKKRGDLRKAQRFRSAARRAAESLDYWTRSKPLRHVKNRFPRDTRYGCEGYGYFDKYMVTMGSWAFLGYLFADESIPDSDLPEDAAATVFTTTPDFHRAFLKAGDYIAQFDAPADGHYDGSGIGRIQRRGAPPMLALSVPFAKNPDYKLDLKNPSNLAILPGWRRDGDWVYSYDGKYTNLTTNAADGKAHLSVDVVRRFKPYLRVACDVSNDDVAITLTGEGELALTVPVFEFDGERKAEINEATFSVSVSLDGWTCRYETNGKVINTQQLYGNRHGHYRRYEVRGTTPLTLNCRIAPSTEKGGS